MSIITMENSYLKNLEQKKKNLIYSHKQDIKHMNQLIKDEKILIKNIKNQLNGKR